MLINRADLRLAIVAGLTNGLGAISGLPYGFYAAMAVLAVCSGSYGNAISLGRQRLLGSLLGELMLVVGISGFQNLPLPLAMGITLGGMRLLGGLLGLKVGYKVGGFIVVMGWLVHRESLEVWLPLRLFWTTVGIVLATLSLRLIWPARAIVSLENGMAALLERLERGLQAGAELLDKAPSADQPSPDPQGPGPLGDTMAAGAAAGPANGAMPPAAPLSLHATQSLIDALAALRRNLPLAERELGNSPRHPRLQLMAELDAACSNLVALLDGLARHASESGARDDAERPLCRAEAELLRDLGERLGPWAASLRSQQDSVQPPPPGGEHRIPWQRLEQLLLEQRPASEADELDRLQHHATVLSQIGLAGRALDLAERRWRELAASA